MTSATLGAWSWEEGGWYDNQEEPTEATATSPKKESSTSLLSSIHMVVDTLEGDLMANVGDYIIKGVAGEFYACKPEIFALTYENVWQPMS